VSAATKLVLIEGCRFVSIKPNSLAQDQCAVAAKARRPLRPLRGLLAPAREKRARFDAAATAFKEALFQKDPTRLSDQLEVD
jgi:hypothetical protein